MKVIEGLRATLVLAWLVSPPFLVLLAVLIRRRTPHAENSKTRTSAAIGSAAVANWILFIVLFIKAQTPYGVVFQTSPLTHALLLLSCFAVIASLPVFRWRWPLLLANFLLITLWVTIAYAPSHWLRDWDCGSVKIDGRPTPASVYIGHPTDSEAEAVILVHVPAAADYFLSFGEEKVRLATEHEYVRVPGGVWSFRSMRTMVFTEPLPFQQINQFRIASPSGGVVSVQF
jgi:hypothetical protein